MYELIKTFYVIYLFQIVILASEQNELPIGLTESEKLEINKIKV